MNKISKEIFEKSNETEINLEKLNTFSKLTKPVKLFLTLLFPFGLVFKFNDIFFKYNFFLGKFKNLNKEVKKYFYFEIPAYEFVESINNGHFTDTGTSFILKISVEKRFDIYRSYLLFVFLTYSEKGYFSNYKLFLKQILLVFKNLMPFKISLR